MPTVGRSFVGSNGRVFVAALVFQRDGRWTCGSSSAAAITGAPAWGPITFDGAAAGYTQLLGPDGVAGRKRRRHRQREGADGTGAWATLKYDRATGTVLWGPVFHPSGNSGLLAVAGSDGCRRTTCSSRAATTTA